MRTFTKLLAPALLGLALAAPAAAQDTADLQAKLDAKLAKSFVTYGNWILDYDQARQIAKDQGKLIFVYFTRSYAP
ncbi:MAG: hypothetical protein QM477_05655 [Planctomycetota bacterium]